MPCENIINRPDGSDSFASPAALIRVEDETLGRRWSRSELNLVPASPPSLQPSGRGHGAHGRAGTSLKDSSVDSGLPPPPTRTLRIVQMNAKSSAKSKHSLRTRNIDNSASQASPKTIFNVTTTTSKGRKPSFTSLSGRKASCKAAHNLTERRRRFKMNEDFSTLKDMIPACVGREMHKLAILQESIEYVNYLEKCILDLETAGPSHTFTTPSLPKSKFIAEGSENIKQRPSSSACISCCSTSTSPGFSSQIPNAPSSFSPRNSANSAKTLPDLHSLPAEPPLEPSCATFEKTPELRVLDHEALTALPMLTHAWRGTASSISAHIAQSKVLTELPEEKQTIPMMQRRKVMSVQDLLVS